MDKAQTTKYIQGWEPEPFAKDMTRQNHLGREYVANGHLEGFRLKTEVRGDKILLGIGGNEALFERNALIPLFNSLLNKCHG